MFSDLYIQQLIESPSLSGGRVRINRDLQSHSLSAGYLPSGMGMSDGISEWIKEIASVGVDDQLDTMI